MTAQEVELWRDLGPACASSRLVVVYEDAPSLQTGFQFARWLAFRGGRELTGRFVPVRLSQAEERPDLGDLLGRSPASSLFVLCLARWGALAELDVDRFWQLVARDVASRKGLIVLGNSAANGAVRERRWCAPDADELELGRFLAWLRPQQRGGPDHADLYQYELHPAAPLAAVTRRAAGRPAARPQERRR